MNSLTRQSLGAFPDREIYTVSRLNFETRDLLESEFGSLWIEGEISNLARPGSGHMYFSLKDERCQVRCAMFKGRNRHLRFIPENGMQVLLRASAGLYPDRGEFQLVVEHMEESGEGALRRAFDALKARLQSEGLFDEERKIVIPSLPTQIGIVTSPTGAAVRDVLSVLKRRFASIPVVIYPVPVQGQGAAEKISQMLELAARRDECDVLILTRGGGSLEDMWAFNEEVLARAIARCPIPIVCGVGHEIDFTIADFVADQRAATPSAAAELTVPDSAEFSQRVKTLTARARQLITTHLRSQRTHANWLSKRLIHPRKYLQNMSQKVDETELRLTRGLEVKLTRCQSSLSVLQSRFHRHSPHELLRHYRTHLDHLSHRLHTVTTQTMKSHRNELSSLLRAFNAVSPQRTLDRGYAIVSDADSGIILRQASEAVVGQKVRTRLASGSLSATVTKTED